MADDKNKRKEETGQIDLIGPSCGERLAAARREKRIAIAEIAKELHISEQKVEALERNEFDLLGAAVFAKGYMRKYGQLVGLDVDDILADYAELTATVDTQPVIKARPRPRREMSPGPWIAVVVVIIVAVTAYWVFTTRPSLPGSGGAPEPDASVVEPAPRNIDAAVIEQVGTATPSVTDDSSPSIEDAGAGQPATTVGVPPGAEPGPESTPVAATQTPAARVQPGSGEMQLMLTYSGDCWTEISDATGRRLYFGLGSDGRTVELSGTAPFDVLLGNANNVSLKVNGSAYVIDSVDRLGRARFSVAGN